MLSGKCEIIDKIVCLEIGADDYLTKPFEPRELLARIRTILRRSQTREATRAAPAVAQDKLACFYGFSCDLDGQTLAGPDGVPIALTGQELRLLTALVQRPGRVLTRDQNSRSHRPPPVGAARPQRRRSRGEASPQAWRPRASRTNDPHRPW